MITDVIEEVYVSMSRNKLRIALTGFSIAWGIFMLIALLSSGNGLLNGVMDNFSSQAVNKVEMWPGYTSMSYDGYGKGREIHLTTEDLDFLCSSMRKHVYEAHPVVESSATVNYGQEYLSGHLEGIYPSFLKSDGERILQGRALNEMDIRDRRKVCLVSENTLEVLFGSKEDAHLGTWINIAGIPFQIVGLYKSPWHRRGHVIYLPLSADCAIFQPRGDFGDIQLLVKNLDTPEANEQFNDDLRALMARHKQFDPDDKNALWIWNGYQDYLQTRSIFSGLQLFIWIIGIATLIAGVTGISNIMLITVRERTHEFGIRKAIGARPRQIVSLVLLESVAITLVFGYIGLFCGIGLTQLLDFIMSSINANTSSDGESVQIFKNPTVDLGIVFMATLIMVIAGVIAGYIPAKRAVSVKPVEALKE